jgi:hypothetical protein
LVAFDKALTGGKKVVSSLPKSKSMALGIPVYFYLLTKILIGK